MVTLDKAGLWSFCCVALVVWLSLVGEVGEVGEAKVPLTGETGEVRSSLVFFFLRKPSDGIV